MKQSHSQESTLFITALLFRRFRKYCQKNTVTTLIRATGLFHLFYPIERYTNILRYHKYERLFYKLHYIYSIFSYSLLRIFHIFLLLLHTDSKLCYSNTRKDSPKDLNQNIGVLKTTSHKMYEYKPDSSILNNRSIV